MKLFLITLSLLPVLVYGQSDTTVTVSAESAIFPVDTYDPQVDWLDPDGGQNYTTDEVFAGTWTATDESFGTNPITVSFATEIGAAYTPVATAMINSGIDNFTTPAAPTDYLRIKIQAQDLFGNVGEDQTTGYLKVGSGGTSDTTAVFAGESSTFTTDTEDPVVDGLYPNGGEGFLGGEQISASWTAWDQSFGSGPISIGIIQTIGDTAIPQVGNVDNVGSYPVTLPNIDTWYGRMAFKAKDAYGNIGVDFSDGYFRIGEPSGFGQDTTAIFTGASPDITTDAGDPVVNLVQPNGGEAYLEGSVLNVTWTAHDTSMLAVPIEIFMATAIGGVFDPQTGSIENDGQEPLTAPAGPMDYGQVRIRAEDTFGNIGTDVSDGYFSVFVMGTGAIQGNLTASRSIAGTLYLSLWFPGHDPESNPPDMEKLPQAVSLIAGVPFLYSFVNLGPGAGYTVGAFIDQNESATTGDGFCDMGQDLSGALSGITVIVDQVSVGADIPLTECPDFDAPSMPTGFSVSSGNHSAGLDWALNPEPDMSGYGIYRGETDVSLDLITIVDHPATHYADSGLVNGNTYFYRITARDMADNESEPSPAIAVIPNGPPVWVALTDTSFLEDDTLRLDLFQLVDDEGDPDDSLEFTVTAGTRIFAIYDQFGHTVTFFTDPDSSGFSESFTLTATDPLGFTAELALTVSVTPVNDRPVITSPDSGAATEDIEFVYNSTGTDVESPALIWTFDILPVWLVPNGNIVNGVPLEGAVDTVFRVIASDGELSDSLVVSVTVAPVNDPPVISSPLTVSATEDIWFSYHATADDPDGPSQTSVFFDLPHWLSAAADSVFGMPLEGDLDTSFSGIVSDGEFQDTMTVTVNVLAVNDAPVLTSALTAAATEDQVFGYRARGYDPEGLPVTWTFSDLPTWISLAGTDSISGVPLEGASDTSCTITGSDGTVFQSWTLMILVAPVNDPPHILSPDTALANSGMPFVYHGSASDPDSPALVWTFQNLPSWLTAAGDSVFGTPEPFHGDTLMVVRVSDGEFEDIKIVSILLNLGNQLPLVQLQPLAGEYHREIHIKTFLSDADNNPLTYLVRYRIGNQPWQPATISGTFGLPGTDTLDITWDSYADLPQAAPDQAQVRITAFDGQGANYSTSGQFSIDNHVGTLNLLVNNESEKSGRIVLPWSILDETGDIYSLAFNYSTDEGVTWTPLTLEETLGPTGVEAYGDSVHWASFTDLPEQDRVVLLAVSLNDGWEFGQGDTMSLHVDNQVLPLMVNSGTVLKRWYDPVRVVFSRDLNEATLSPGISVSGTQGTYPVSAMWDGLDRSVTITPSTVWIAGEQLTLALSHTIEDLAGNPLDGNGNGDPDGAGDDISVNYSVHYLGDYDETGTVDFSDLVLFRNAWLRSPADPNEDLGPALGVPPFFQVIPDTLIDFEDLMVFAQMWNWSGEQAGGILARSAQLSDGATVGLTVTYPPREFGQQDDKINIVASVDSLVGDIGALALTLNYDMTQLEFLNGDLTLDNRWMKLKRVSTTLGYAILQTADLDSARRSIRGNFAVLTFRRLAGETADFGLFYDIRDRIGNPLMTSYGYRSLSTVRPLPEKFALKQNYPNPFNPTTNISYDLPEDVRVRLVVYDILGKEVRVLVDEPQVAGFYTIRWDGKNSVGGQASAGMYLMNLQTRTFSAVKKLILLK